jgi:hypothetical protein
MPVPEVPFDIFDGAKIGVLQTFPMCLPVSRIVRAGKGGRNFYSATFGTNNFFVF